MCKRLSLCAPLALFLLICCSQGPHSSPPRAASYADLVLTNGRIFTGAPTKGFCESIAIRGSTIVGVGSSEILSRWIGPDTRVIALDGRSVLPGFHDAHIHFYYGSLASLGLDLLLAPSLPLVLSAVAEYAASHPEMDWIVGRGWYFDTLPGGRLPSKADLDPLFPDRPVMLVHMSGHIAWVNSQALGRVGIDAGTPDPPRGIIGRDPETGEPNGLLFEAAMGLVYGPALAGIDSETKTRTLLQKLKELNAMGITSIDEVFLTLGVSDVDLSSYLALERQGMLTCRINLFLSGDLEAETIRGWRDELAAKQIRLAGLKVFVDGNFQAHTAWLIEPYADRPESRGAQIYTQAELNEIAIKGQCLGLPVKFHAIGDAAVRSALDAIAAAQAACPEMEASHSLEHVELLHPEDLRRFSSLRAVASVQPVTAFFNTTLLLGSLTAAVGPERTGYLFPNRSLKDAGTNVLFGTDWPSVPFMEPLTSLFASLIRPGQTDPDFGYPPAPQAFTLEEALPAYTSLPARAIGQDRMLGTLEEGKLADLTVLSEDIFSLTGSKPLAGVKVDLTLLNGRIVFVRGSEPPPL